MKANSPYFSIIIPTLNEEKYLPNLLKDLKSQTNHDFEVIIIDAHSEDKTVSHAKKYASHFPLSVIDSADRNVCLQRNTGGKAAQGSWLLFMDADNRLPTYFLQGLRYQIDKFTPLVFTSFFSPDSKHSLDKTIAQVVNTFLQTQQLAKKPYIIEAMIGIQKKAFLKVGGFDPTVKWGEGGDLLSRLNTTNKRVLRVFKEPQYTYSFRRIRSEGKLKIIRNSAPLILAHQTGRKLDEITYQKLYPMFGGKMFEPNYKPETPVEQIIKDLVDRYQLESKITRLKAPFKKHSGFFQSIFHRQSR